MPETDVAKKLKLKPGQRAAVLFAPPGFRESLGELPEGVALADENTATGEPEASYDFVQFFVTNVADAMERAPQALRALKHDGLLWACYPKGSSKIKTDINRDRGWSALTEAGLRPVSQISLDETWSALRFRPVELVGK